MAKKRYENISIFPLEFDDGQRGVQQVETGETFERDFTATSGESHEKWLTQLGHIREVVDPVDVTKTPSGPVKSKEK